MLYKRTTHLKKRKAKMKNKPILPSKRSKSGKRVERLIPVTPSTFRWLF
ncbi:MAG: hypothetical protein HY840_00805 [Bacteroidetes bacterium]|nr:hypothetical protein [Bacteroidota bacterium]